MVVGRETAECLETVGGVACVKDISEVAGELFVVVVLVPFDGRVPDRPVHPLDLAVR